MSRPCISVAAIVACRNERRHIRTFLDSLVQQQTGNLDCEFVIADGMSDDGTRKIIHEYCDRYPRFRMIDNPGRIVSAGLNAAIRETSAEVILRLDAHTEYALDYVFRCVETLEATGAENVGGPARTRTSGRVGEAIACAYRSRFSTGGARFHDPDYEGYVDTVTYGCWRRETLERLGVFDEMLVRNQDDEHNLRIIRSGGKIWQSPKILSWYYTRSSFASLFRQYFQYGFWKIAVIRKHRIPASWRQLVPGTWLMANLILLAAAAAAALLGHGMAARLLAGAWSAAAAAYGASSLLFACRAANSRVDLIPLIMLAFAVYQISYGLGFLTGLYHWPRMRARIATLNERFSEITR